MFLIRIFVFIAVGLLLFGPPSHTHAQETTDTVADMTAGEAADLLSQYYGNAEEVAPQTDDLILELPPEEFYRANVIDILSEYTENIEGGYTEQVQELKVKILNGAEKGKTQTIVHSGLLSVDYYQKVSAGDTVILVKTYTADGGTRYDMVDHYRLRPLAIILAVFIALVIFFGRRRGIGALLGLAFSIFMLVQWIVPKIVAGDDALRVTIVGSIIIACVSLFLAHGFRKRTLLALVSTAITLFVTLGLSELMVRFAYLFGKGSEEAFYLQIDSLAYINLRGLLLAGIVIGTLGVLDDITTAQTAVVGELRQANGTLSMRELYRRGLIVGREHIASLVNTLVLAYAGAALPLFILFSIYDSVPLWMTLNSERIAEEFIRAIVGSTALTLAVPITTFIAAYFLRNEKIHEEK